ncbi:MAG TPA: acyl carrier protein [Candidatus Limnocylindria bacterium]|nr:acyl carrier protein [Candidatus Limnocylindria bacterium]
MSFEKADTYNKIIAIIAEELKLEPTEITNSSTFQNLGADSLDMVQIIMRLEEQFGIEIKDQDAEKMHNVGDVVEYIHAGRTK